MHDTIKHNVLRLVRLKKCLTNREMMEFLGQVEECSLRTIPYLASSGYFSRVGKKQCPFDDKERYCTTYTISPKGWSYLGPEYLKEYAKLKAKEKKDAERKGIYPPASSRLISPMTMPNYVPAKHLHLSYGIAMQG